MVEPLRTIGDHGIVGDLETAALVARDGTIDYLCWPALDSPTIFADLLDNGKGGAFEIKPQLDNPRHVQLYVPDTNVLITRFMADSGSAEVVDLMPQPEARMRAGRCARSLIRRLTVTSGTVTFTMHCAPRFDYARHIPEVAAIKGGVCFKGEELSLSLSASVPLEPHPAEATARFTLSKGQSAWFVLGDHTIAPPEDALVSPLTEETIKAWRAWHDKSTYKERWREHVLLSALALKLLTSARYGSIAAAATFSLPEALGSERNWDYRATWIRDASFTVYAFMRLGFIEEAEHFNHWVSERVGNCERSSPLRIMFALDGSAMAEETELSHLAGSADSQPVRFGNAAHAQTQLDIFGELLDSVYLSN